MTTQTGTPPPPIWRCEGCGALVHPADEVAAVAWCLRCRRVVRAVEDGARRPA